MAYRFNSQETVEANVHRIIDEQLAKAHHQLTDIFAHRPAHAIHDTRKRLKKSRSVLRLVRKSLDKETYQREKNSLRDAGRLLAPVRDSEVYPETLNNLLEQKANLLDMNAFADVQSFLLDYHGTQLRKITSKDEPVTEVRLTLKNSADRLKVLTLNETGWESIRKNLMRIYRQGKERFETAYQECSNQAFHEWRKRVKDLWYDTRLLRTTWSPVMNAFESEAHLLSKYLGDDHDMAELREFLLNCQDDGIKRDSYLKMLLPLMEQYQDSLRRRAHTLGQRIYAETPNAFIDRMEAYWKVWSKT